VLPAWLWLFSEQTCNEYATQKMFFQSQLFPTVKSQKNPDLSGFFYFQKASKVLKKGRISKSGFKIPKLATPGAEMSRLSHFAIQIQS